MARCEIHKQTYEVTKGEYCPACKGVSAVRPKSLQDAITAWERGNKSGKLETETRRSYSRLMRQLRTWSESAKISSLSDLTLEAIDDFRAWRDGSQDEDDGLASSTIAKEFSILRAFLNFCEARHWSQNPLKDAPGPKVPDNEVEPYSEADKARIMFACEQIGSGPRPDQAIGRLRVKAAISVMRWTGLRISDVLRLRLDQVNTTKHELMIFTKKNKRQIFLPIPLELEMVLAALPPPNGSEPGNPHYFWNGKSAMQTLYSDMQRVLRHVYELSGVPRAKNHRWRHTFISERLAAGVSVRVMADIMGITERVLWRHYSKWMQERQDQITAAMNQFYAKKQPAEASLDRKRVM